MLEITEHILDTKTEDFDRAFLEDRYRSVLVEKLRDKQAERPMASAASAPSKQNVVNLMDALKRSLAKERPASPVLKPTQRRGASASKRTSPKRSQARARRAG
jgi:non-homologous end joining protein Ku